ncbi:LacI family DNA-binding transcriptional regulator [Timonella senegalensis]|uniref:LacI family DNA-binding transcriptional regulator n=1 Tax=Timonella senegalensis TaxID=1465825 RepID=UPI003899666E
MSRTEAEFMSATMQDVAKLAGVSVKTVSNVVTGIPISARPPRKRCSRRSLNSATR